MEVHKSKASPSRGGGTAQAVTERSYQICGNLSVTFGDSSPLEGRLRGGPNTEICVTCGGTEAMMAAVPGSSFFKEPVNHLIRMHFARGTDVLDEAVRRLAKLTELLK